MCRFYSLRPSDIDDMTAREVVEFSRQMPSLSEREGGA